jgi:hypothetical protein
MPCVPGRESGLDDDVPVLPATPPASSSWGIDHAQPVNPVAINGERIGTGHLTGP